MVSTGAMFSSEVKHGLIEHIPALTIADVLGSTEGGMGSSITTKDTPANETAKFTLSATSKVFTDDGREVEPGSAEIGAVANGGLIPLGYYKDPEKSARTFREVHGTRYSFPGDMATVATDGTLVLCGRGSNCINTGGEKVFPEEVEETLKRHSAVEDALVFGVPDDRFGQRVAGVAQPRPQCFDRGHPRRCPVPPLQLQASEGDLRRGASAPRTANGKANYPAARELFRAGRREQSS